MPFPVQLNRLGMSERNHPLKFWTQLVYGQHYERVGTRAKGLDV
jgi:hypothetical protein